MIVRTPEIYFFKEKKIILKILLENDDINYDLVLEITDIIKI